MSPTFFHEILWRFKYSSRFSSPTQGFTFISIIGVSSYKQGIFILDMHVFYLMVFDEKDETISPKFKLDSLLPMEINRLSDDSSRENNKMIHLSLSDILISIYNN